ncbi:MULTISPECIES: SIR2 family NAD-dependent protein deacylase [Comamonas]|uniref:NAD-dependent protein deacylase n=1 Tax=Comamonas terrigena TaxID=32013 RepID=A0A2A7UWF2_COMTR|nr:MULTISPECIES: NAD-dependent deacylase [Comamonas]MBD9531559.1 NAD-dependent deacylase [Comamonas sp. CMM01]PEH89557.1 NAD-dependent deacylase [Comamonas terrigena]BBL24743.1 NAD-dependent protein deacylase [Comamonas terrigena NBRC 13299]SUY71665.1 NAD-dependent deacetylase [Comamonas terrigena]
MPAAEPDHAIEAVRDWIAQSRRLCVLTGAGVSAESGVPTFRDAQTGYWAQFRAEDMASEPGFRAHPARVWHWYQHRRGLVSAVAPNAAHHALAGFAAQHPGRLTLVTQNVDGLHQRAGSPDVVALHGDLFADQWLDACCPQCTPALQAGQLTATEPPACPYCGNLRRPGVVWFGECLPQAALDAAEVAAQGCDLMLVAGTAGVVYPAAGLVLQARDAGARVVIVNTAPTELDRLADAMLQGAATTVLPALLG